MDGEDDIREADRRWREMFISEKWMDWFSSSIYRDMSSFSARTSRRIVSVIERLKGSKLLFGLTCSLLEFLRLGMEEDRSFTGPHFSVSTASLLWSTSCETDGSGGNGNCERRILFSIEIDHGVASSDEILGRRMGCRAGTGGNSMEDTD
jgi:hypothetical protein